MKSHQLLIVAWLSDIKNSIEKVLRNNNYVFDSVSSPIEAIDATGRYAYKVVVIDSLLPGLNGYQLVKRLGSTPHGEYAKFIVFMNNIPSDKLADVNKRWGIHALLKKPIDADELLSILKSAEAYDLPSEKLEFHTSESIEEMMSEFAHLLWTGKTSCYNDSGIIKEIYWDGGNPVFAISNNVNERLDNWLLNKGLVSESILKSAYDIMNKKGKRLGDTLIMLGVIEEDALEQAVSDNMESIILDMFSWNGVRYTKEEKTKGIKEFASIKDSFPIMLYEGIKQNVDIERIKKKLEGMGGIISFVPDNIFNIEDFGFPHSFSRVLSIINGKRTVYELIAKSGLTHDDAYMFIYTLLLLKFIRLSPAAKAKAEGFAHMPRIHTEANQKTRFTGNLHDISVVELIQMLELNRKSGAMQIDDANEIGWLLFDKGKIVDAYYGDITRENAVYRILFLTDGEFNIKFKKIVGERRINIDTQTLLMEGLRLQDEAKRLESSFGGFKKRLVINPSHKFNTEEEKEELARIFNGKNDLLTSSFLLNPNIQTGLDILNTLLKNKVITERKK